MKKILPGLIIIIGLIFISGISGFTEFMSSKSYEKILSSISPVKISDLDHYNGQDVWIQGEIVSKPPSPIESGIEVDGYIVKDESGSAVIYRNKLWETQSIGDKVKILVHVITSSSTYKGQYIERLILGEKERIIISSLKPVPNLSISDIQLTIGPYGYSSVPSSGIDEIKFVIGLTPRLPTLDLTKMNIAFSTSTSAPVILTYGSSATTSTFLASINSEGGSPVPSLTEQQQVWISFKVAPVPKNTQMNIEIRPSVGRSIPFSRTIPSAIDIWGGGTVLY